MIPIFEKIFLFFIFLFWKKKKLELIEPAIKTEEEIPNNNVSNLLFEELYSKELALSTSKIKIDDVIKQIINDRAEHDFVILCKKLPELFENAKIRNLSTISYTPISSIHLKAFSEEADDRTSFEPGNYYYVKLYNLLYSSTKINFKYFYIKNKCSEYKIEFSIKDVENWIYNFKKQKDGSTVKQHSVYRD